MMAEHSFSARRGEECGLCLDRQGRPGACDQTRYTPRFRRFVLAHREEYLTALLNPDQATSRAELERLDRERRTLPPRHSCSCQKRNAQGVWSWDCLECRHLEDQRPKQVPDVGVEIGRTQPVNAPMPNAMLLDLLDGKGVEDR